jgi:hypothetical protein
MTLINSTLANWLDSSISYVLALFLFSSFLLLSGEQPASPVASKTSTFARKEKMHESKFSIMQKS